MEPFSRIGTTLNELLFNVLSGVDYVSKLAISTGKSIPVVHRQLESLVELGMLSREREGKKVLYGVNWQTMSSAIASIVMVDVARMRSLFPEADRSALRKAEVQAFFSAAEVQKLFRSFIGNLQKAGAHLEEYRKLSFERSVDLFLDVFGRGDAERLLSERMRQEHGAFLRYCRLRYDSKQRLDPRNL